MKQPIPFGKYFLLERVNVGGMAEVFKAKTTGVEGFERTVAVKRILPGIAEDEEFVTMFVDEAKIAGQLTHANIAQIFDLGRADGSFYIALEYVQGKDLRAILNRVRQRGELLPIPFACYIIMKVCEGLDYAHNKQDGAGRFLNLVHRDVSPQNVLVSYEGEVKLIDFGIVKALGKAGKTQVGILKGKFGYMSPEQILGVEVDRRSDVFGVGICLYELLTGERLFAAETDFATLEKVKAGVIMPPSTYNPRIPEELEQIVLRALAKDRNARYATALALHDALQAFMHTSGSLFSRKDLGLYMHRVFADEIKKENARDAEHAQSGGSVAPSVPALPPTAANGSGSPGVSAAKPAAAHSPRRRTGTLLGVQPAAAAASIPAFSGTASRPPLAIPSSASRPPAFTSSPASPSSRELPASTSASPASRPPLPVEPQAPTLQAAAPELVQSMEWDDDELSTQIYDKPESGRLRHETQEEFRALPRSEPDAAAQSVPEAEPAQVPESDDDDLDSLQASVPDSMDADAGLQAAQFTGHALVHPARNSDPGPASLRLTPPPAAVPAVTWEKPAQQPGRARPMLAAVLVVLAIIGLIVGGLAAFRQQEPGTVSLTTRPSRVDVAVDGHALGSSTSPFVIGELTPDRPHEIIVSSPGHAPWKKTVSLTPGQLLTLSDVALEPIETGFVLSSDPPLARVFIDEREQPGKTPLRIADLTPGEHRIRVELSGFATWESTLNAEKGVVLPLTQIHLRALPSAEPLPEVTARMSRRGALNPERERERPDRVERGDRDKERPASESMSAEKAAPAKPEPAAAPPEPEREPLEKLEIPAANPYKVEPVANVAAVSAAVEEPAASPQPAAAEASAEGKTGKLRVNSRPWSQVFIDGKSYGATPRLNIELPAGAHTLRLVNDEFHIEKVEQLQIVAGETRSVIINLLEQ